MTRIGVRVELNDAEQRLCRYMATKRHQVSRESSVPNSRKGPQSDEFTDLNGIGGEISFCRLFNCYPDLSVYARTSSNSRRTSSGGSLSGTGEELPKDTGDVNLNGVKIDIKTTHYATGRLLVAPWKSDDIKYYALMVGKFPLYTFKGFSNYHTIVQEENLINLGHGEVYVLGQDRLRDDFLELSTNYEG